MDATTPYNEVFEAEGKPREPYAPLAEAIGGIGVGAFAGRKDAAYGKLRELGATFPLSDDPGERERILPADWLPRIVPREHWERLSRGLLQRGRAINAWLADLYGPGQNVVPQEIVESSFFYRPQELPGGSPAIHVYGPDVVHLGDGEYVVLEDNVRVPSGVAYSEALRVAGREAMPEIFTPYPVADISGYFAQLRRSLESAAPAGVENPTVAVVTRGKGDSAYFEHHRIAEACGFRLLTLADCKVEDGKLKDRSDRRRIDVVYRRFDEDYIETDLPELEEVYRQGGVTFANALGVGVADDKAVFPYVPDMIRAYLEEEPVLRNAVTHSLADPAGREETLGHLKDFVLKPREGSGGHGLMVGPEAGDEEVEQARHAAKEDPLEFIAQECLDFSTHMLGDENADGGPREAFVDLRAFVLPAVGYVMPGGLTRVANPGTRVVNSSSGGKIKDTWVLE